MFSLEECLFSSSTHFKIRFVFTPFFAIELYDFFMYFENTPLSDEVKVLVESDSF